MLLEDVVEWPPNLMREVLVLVGTGIRPNYFSTGIRPNIQNCSLGNRGDFKDF